MSLDFSTTFLFLGTIFLAIGFQVVNMAISKVHKRHSEIHTIHQMESQFSREDSSTFYRGLKSSRLFLLVAIILNLVGCIFSYFAQ